MLLRKLTRWTLAAAAAMSLAACPLEQASDVPQSRNEAWRFLTQATFGPSEADINRVTAIGYSAWIDEQLAKPSAKSYRAHFESRDAEIRPSGPASFAGENQVIEHFYTRALTDDAQLRHRVALALSEIFVVSFTDTKVAAWPQMMVAYLDMLDKGVNGSYRELLEGISTSTAMGQYLSFRSNAKENPAIGQSPDENYAREIMQLFSIGLYELNPDGTLKLNDAGKPTETYTNADVKGLAKVFTGWSHSRGSVASSVAEARCFYLFPDCTDPQGLYGPMVPYNNFHSTSEKRFLGTVIPAQGTPDAVADMRIALDALARHPNTAPHFSRQLIQRLVTSNPRPAYVQRVAQRFVDTNGSIPEVVKAILLDDEARSVTAFMAADYGKLREPVLRLTALLRAFTFRSPTWPQGGSTTTVPYVAMNQTSDPSTSLGQTPFYAPSVFNFFRPGYVMAQSNSARLGLVGPEFQITSETSVTGYVNLIKDLVTDGIGATVLVNGVWQRGVTLDVTEQAALAHDAQALTAHVADRLLGGNISADLSQAMQTVLNTMPVPAADATQSNSAAIQAALAQRARAAILLVAASPEYLIQR